LRFDPKRRGPISQVAVQLHPHPHIDLHVRQPHAIVKIARPEKYPPPDNSEDQNYSKKRENTMKKLIAMIAGFLLTANSLGYADVVSFNTCKLADVKGKQADATLIFSDDAKNVQVRVSDRDLVTIPYENLDKVSYEFTKKHRITQGAIVMVASLGAGAIVMLTKSKSHWLYIDYREQDASKTVVLRLDKSDYKKVLEAVRTHTGKEVLMLGDSTKTKG
jgi:hypothetical protein